MSALVLGKRSSCFFEELHQPISAGAANAPSSPTCASKRGRFGDSPFRLSPPRWTASPPGPSPRDVSSASHAWAGIESNSGACNSASRFAHLRSLFPDMDDQLLERALEASGNDLDSAIRSLNELCLGSAERGLHFVVNNSVEGIGIGVQPSTEVIVDNSGENAAAESSKAVNNIPVDGSEWVELLVREMMNSTDVDDARARASSVLEVLEKSIMARAGAEAAQAFHKENVMLKEQVEGLLRDNNILKRAVSIQHERQKHFDEKDQEVQHLKQLLSQYQEQIRTLEINNYALSMHLKQAQQGSSIPGRFHPDENVMLKEQVEGLLRDNNILKRAVSIQHERQKHFDEKDQEVQHLKQLLSQYQEQIRTLEINNYALSMHLKQAQQGSSIPGRFHPDVF
ncbi:hypothetical protein Taro_001647 [Colocasia esculenta]|uniref:CUE domain-containing protein n=1 Tax=Colocasia esculenta TaxID=4460 RepID=A0A843TE57_COLES|nr:hypothetical protein [Colocasia esculenta]